MRKTIDLIQLNRNIEYFLTESNKYLFIYGNENIYIWIQLYVALSHNEKIYWFWIKIYSIYILKKHFIWLE